MYYNWSPKLLNCYKKAGNKPSYWNLSWHVISERLIPRNWPGNRKQYLFTRHKNIWTNILMPIAEASWVQTAISSNKTYGNDHEWITLFRNAGMRFWGTSSQTLKNNCLERKQQSFLWRKFLILCFLIL